MIGVIKKASEIAEFFQDGWYYICVIMLIFNDSLNHLKQIWAYFWTV